jgi:hypothetical protein
MVECGCDLDEVVSVSSRQRDGRVVVVVVAGSRDSAELIFVRSLTVAARMVRSVCAGESWILRFDNSVLVCHSVVMMKYCKAYSLSAHEHETGDGRPGRLRASG